ncbi:MAG: glycosyltransferase family 2 protein [Bacteroidota bacterium]
MGVAGMKMKENKFTLIVPTRERANTLFYSLQTCVAQTYQNFEILVSDNFSGDNTKAVVESFNDPRIRYINTGERLSMSKNWEFALSHVTDGWVGFIGDDDGLMPGGIAAANELLLADETGSEVIYWYDKMPWYYWAGEYGGSGKDNHVFLNVLKDYSPFVAKERLMKMASLEASYESLPTIYHGFCSMDLIKRIKENSKDGLFFHSCIPDVYSTIPISIFSKSVLLAPESLSINGVSNNSTGGSSFFKNDLKTVKKFLSEVNIPFSHYLNLDASDNVMPNVNILITDAFLRFVDYVDSDFSNNREELRPFLLWHLINKIKNDSTYKYLVDKFVSYNHLENFDIKENKIYKAQNAKRKYFYYKYGYKINCEKYGTKTIADIALVYRQVANTQNWDMVKHNFGRNFKALKRYARYLMKV